MTQRAIVLVGLIRDPDNFVRFLDALLARRDQHIHCIFSTWHGELPQYPEIERKLNALDATIFVQYQPDLVMPGHMLHQLAALDLGVAFLPDDVLVLKTRPDFCDPRDIDRLLELPLAPPTVTSHLPTPFRHRVHCKGGFAAHPFYLNDISYIATAGDIRGICHFPLLTPIRYTHLGPEQSYWGAGFIPAVPPLDSYFRVNYGLVFDNPDKSKALIGRMMASPSYIRALACAFLIKRDNFSALTHAVDPDDMAEQIARYTLDQLLWEPVQLAGLTHNNAVGTNTIRSQAIWDAMAAGAYAPSEFGDQVRAWTHAYDAESAVADMRADLRGYSERATNHVLSVRDGVDQQPMRNLRKRGQQWVVDAGHINWRMAQTGTDATKALEEQITVLRRTVEDLRDKLARAENLPV